MSNRPARPGLVSTGTNSPTDLAGNFATELCLLDVDGVHRRLLDSARRVEWHGRPTRRLVADLARALDTFAPEGHHFGLRDEAGFDYGFWPR